MTDDARLKAAADTYKKLYNAEWKLEERSGEPANGLELSTILFQTCFADSWSRDDTLSPKTKELVTVAIMVSEGLWQEYKMHLIGAMLVGNTKEELIDVLIHLAGYLGVPRTVEAWRLARKVFAEYPEYP